MTYNASELTMGHSNTSELVVPDLIKKLIEFHANPSLITIFTTDRHLPYPETHGYSPRSTTLYLRFNIILPFKAHIFQVRFTAA